MDPGIYHKDMDNQKVKPIIKPYETGYQKYLTEDEFKRIYTWFTKHVFSPPMLMCLEMLCFLGLRVGEAVRLKRTDFNSDFSVLTFTLEKSQKVHERKLPVFLQKKLKSYWYRYKHRMKEGYLFFSSYSYSKSPNPHLQISSVELKFKEVREALKLNEVYYTTKNGNPLHRISPHTMRHFVVFQLYKAGNNDLMLTKSIIGHTKADTTARYISSIRCKEKELETIEKAFEGIINN